MSRLDGKIVETEHGFDVVFPDGRVIGEWRSRAEAIAGRRVEIIRREQRRVAQQAPMLGYADRDALRTLYRVACHGAGAEPRRAARQQIDQIIARAGLPLGEAFALIGLDLAAYFASRPIG